MTLHGTIFFTPRGGPRIPGVVNWKADHWNVLVDATTGNFVSNGTEGTPLSAG